MTARQVLLIFTGLSVGYVIWNNLGFLGSSFVALNIRGLLGTIPALFCIAAAFIQLAGRGLEQWALIAAIYFAMPKVYLWKLLDYEDLWSEREKISEEDKKLEEGDSEGW